MQQTLDDVLAFWFKELTSKQWWATSDDLDRHIEARFGALHYAAVYCELYCWRESSKGRLAEIIILDQFSRKIYRNHSNTFAYDSLALALAQTAVANNADHEMDINQRAFFYMAYMHSELLLIHEIAVVLFGRPGMEANLQFELRYKEIIDRFGRYPHRNAILGRPSTPEEIDFLKTEGSLFWKKYQYRPFKIVIFLTRSLIVNDPLQTFNLAFRMATNSRRADISSSEPTGITIDQKESIFSTELQIIRVKEMPVIISGTLYLAILG